MAGMKGATQQDFRAITPRWALDELNKEHLLPGGVTIDPSGFVSVNSTSVEIDGAMTVGGTTVIIDGGLTKPIPMGGILANSLTAPEKTFRLRQAGKIGDTVLQVEPILATVASGQLLYYTPYHLYLPSGSLIGRTYAERDAGTLFGPAASTDDEFYITVYDVSDLREEPFATVYRPGSLVAENLLPGWAGLSSQLKAKIRAVYQTTVGAK